MGGVLRERPEMPLHKLLVFAPKVILVPVLVKSVGMSMHKAAELSLPTPNDSSQIMYLEKTCIIILIQ